MMQRGILALVVAFFGYVLAHTAGLGFGVSGGGSTANIMTVYDLSPGCNTLGNVAAGFNDATGYNPQSTALTPGQKTFIQVVVGDSISANSGVTYAVTSGTAAQILNYYTGLNYQAGGKLLGASDGPGGYPYRIADKLITAAKFARVITIDISQGGHCSSDVAKTGPLNHRARIACLWARALGWPVSGSGDTANWKMGFLYAMGVNDNIKGTFADYTTNFQSWLQSMRDYGCAGDVFVATSTAMCPGGGTPPCVATSTVNPTLQALQAGVVDNLTVFAGANRDILTGSTNGDGLHLTTAAGNDSYATDWANRIIAHY